MRADPSTSPWMTAEQSARYLGCSKQLLYREVKANRCKAARIGGRRDLRFLKEWLDEFLIATTTPQPVQAEPKLRSVS